MGVAANTRRLLGTCGGAARQDVMISEEVYGPLGGDSDQWARATKKEAQKQRAGQKRRDGFPKGSRDKEKGDGETLNGSNCRAGTRNPYLGPESQNNSRCAQK